MGAHRDDRQGSNILYWVLVAEESGDNFMSRSQKGVHTANGFLLI